MVHFLEAACIARVEKLPAENLKKVNLFIHLDLILQMKQPQIITEDDLIDMTYHDFPNSQGI